MLNKRIKWQLDNPNRGLTFKSLNLDSVKLVVYTDPFGANNNDMSSQIRYVIVMVDDNNTANLLHWSSIKCKLITRSVLASELYAMVHGFDMGIAIKTTICAMLGRQIPLYLCTDSQSLYDQTIGEVEIVTFTRCRCKIDRDFGEGSKAANIENAWHKTEIWAGMHFTSLH
ncbi:hypothetical protein EV44_g3645 [Erysiphe necator]|uniref:Uncharacterized protein n=1 Tax=Uncinula necator TaxID=52586 RepID=A0A0B1P6E1_UNCNE|nr:hypothetical protein EV44_g3645 [Erysiphe necator]